MSHFRMPAASAAERLTFTRAESEVVRAALRLAISQALRYADSGGVRHAMARKVAADAQSALTKVELFEKAGAGDQEAAGLRDGQPSAPVDRDPALAG